MKINQGTTGRRWRRRALAALALAAFPGLVLASDAGAWRRSAIWDDGKAEFCAYEIEWPRYGVSNQGRALLIAVKEPWAPDLEVKADAERADGFAVIKLNHVRDVPTGIYTYHQMASAFLTRETGELRKLAATSSEGCGISTAELVGGELATSSYFDGQGRRSQRFPEDALAFDALPLALRDLLEGPVPESLEVFPSLMAGRFPELAARRYGIERRRARREVPAGAFETVEVELRADVTRFLFAFAAESPHPLIYFEDDAGTVYELAKCERIVYWRMNRPGGELWLPEPVR